MINTLGWKFSVSAILWAATATTAHALVATFDTPSSPANLATLYPEFTATAPAGAEWSVSNGKAWAVRDTGSTTDLFVLPGFVNPFSGVGHLIEGTIGAASTGVSAGSFNVGLSFGGRSFLFHPGYSGGAMRVDGLVGNTNMGFTPAWDKDYRMQVRAFDDSGTKKYRVTVTDTTNPLNNAFAITVDETSPPSSLQSAGFRRSGAVGTGFFDNLSIFTPHLRLSASNPTDGKRTSGTTVWADSGGTQSDATLAGSSGSSPQFQQGVDGYGNTVRAYTYQFNSGNWGVVADTPATHAENFLVSGWYKLDRLPGVKGASGWQIFAENGDYYTGAEWLWYNDQSGRMWLRYSTGAGTGNDVEVKMAHGMQFLPNQFVHLAVAKEGSDVTMFVNGQPIGTQASLPTTVADRNAGITLGSYNRNGGRGGDPLNGQIGEFQFYNLAVDTRPAADIVAENYRGRYYDFHNRNPILLKAGDADGGGRTAAVANLWADLGGNENDAVMHGTPTVQTGWPPAPVMNFGQGDYLRINDTPSTHVQNFLVEGWFQFDRLPTPGATTWVTLAQNGDAFAGQGGAADEYGAEWLWHIDENNINLSVWDTTATAFTNSELLAAPHDLSVADDFVHLAAARDGDRLLLFVNGEEVASQTLANFAALNDGTAGISIGTYIRNGASGGDAFTGRIGEFNIWDVDTLGAELSSFVSGQYTQGFPLYVPEPSSFILALLALLGLAGRRRRNPISE